MSGSGYPPSGTPYNSQTLMGSTPNPDNLAPTGPTPNVLPGSNPSTSIYGGSRPRSQVPGIYYYPKNLFINPKTIEFNIFLNSHESCISNNIISNLNYIEKEREIDLCDTIFLEYWNNIHEPYLSMGLGHRAAKFARETLIPSILNKEINSGIQYHKGGIFYNTAITHLEIGDVDRFDYFLAMADDEDTQSLPPTGIIHKRGTLPKKAETIGEGTAKDLITVACKLLNGEYQGNPSVSFKLIYGKDLSEDKFNTWRRTLDREHGCELLRILGEAKVFLGSDMPSYKTVEDHPYILLRLAKVLAHLAQWVESYLTLIQKAKPPAGGNGTSKSLGSKIINDKRDFALLFNAAVNADTVAGNNPSDPDKEIKNLISDIKNQNTLIQKEWRIMRILYIVRNSTAHNIDESSDIYKNRDYVLNLMSCVFISVFLIEKFKNKYTI